MLCPSSRQFQAERQTCRWLDGRTELCLRLSSVFWNYYIFLNFFPFFIVEKFILKCLAFWVFFWCFAQFSLYFSTFLLVSFFGKFFLLYIFVFSLSEFFSLAFFTNCIMEIRRCSRTSTDSELQMDGEMDVAG